MSKESLLTRTNPTDLLRVFLQRRVDSLLSFIEHRVGAQFFSTAARMNALELA
jgi:hypothetical protein